MKVVDCLLVYSKEKVENYISICFLLIKLLSEEKVGMQYIGGYVFYKFYNKYVNINKLLESEQVIFILKVGKVWD